MKPTFHHTKLTNGLQILGEVNTNTRSSAIGFFVKTGARDEHPDVMGVSHFLEHMMFKGTQKRSALDINYELGALGAQANAFTSEENTVFYAGVLPENFTKTLELFSDMLRPALKEEDFDMEKKVILEEIALYQDKPHYFLYEKAIADYFSGTQCGHSVLGSNETISNMSAKQMRDYFELRYGAANTCVVASGNFIWDEFVASVESFCGNWSSGSAGRAEVATQELSRTVEIKKKSLAQSQVLILAKAASVQEQACYPMSLLASILGDSSGSKLYWELVHSGLAESASCDHDDRDGYGLFMGSISCDHDKIQLCLDKLDTIIDAASDFSDSELELAKRKLCSRIVTNGELSMGRLMAIGLEWNFKTKVTPLAEVIEKIRAVSREDIYKALEKYPLKIRSNYILTNGD
jgi:predicted Zn-dependent peptidase